MPRRGARLMLELLPSASRERERRVEHLSYRVPNRKSRWSPAERVPALAAWSIPRRSPRDPGGHAPIARVDRDGRPPAGARHRPARSRRRRGGTAGRRPHGSDAQHARCAPCSFDGAGARRLLLNRGSTRKLVAAPRIDHGRLVAVATKNLSSRCLARHVERIATETTSPGYPTDGTSISNCGSSSPPPDGTRACSASCSSTSTTSR